MLAVLQYGCAFRLNFSAQAWAARYDFQGIGLFCKGISLRKALISLIILLRRFDFEQVKPQLAGAMGPILSYRSGYPDKFS